MPEERESKPKEEYQKTTLWLKQHWREVAVGAMAALAAVWYLFIRGKGASTSGGTVASSIPAASGTSASDQQAQQDAIASSSQAATSGIQALAAQVVKQIKDATTAQQTAFQQQLQAAQGAQAQQQASFGQTVQLWIAQLTQSEQQAQADLQKQASQLQVALGQAPSGVATGTAPLASSNAPATASQIAQWANNLGINVQTATLFVQQNGGKLATSLDQLDTWLKNQGNWNGGLSPQANQYKQQQGSNYQPGNVSATVNNPAGGGLWKGQTDQQIQQLFQNTYGANWKQVWNQQHQAALDAGK